MNILSPSSVAAAAENAREKLLGDGVADLRPTPSDVIHKGPQRTVRRYRQPWESSQRTPVLLVPPLASPVQCFDLRRGNSLAENLVSLGYETYLVDYGWIRFSDRDLGLEHWVEDVIPAAAEAVLEDSGADSVQLVGWCLGGIMSLLSVADQRVAASSVAMIASPFDFARVRLMAPVRRLAGLTGGALGTALYRALGGAPSPLVRVGFQLTSIDRYLTKPLWMAQNLDNREALAQTEAVDRFMANMIAYPGRTFGQLYHQFFRVNELSGGRLDDVRRPGRTLDASTSPSSPSPAAATCSPRSPPSTTSATSCRTPRRSASRPPPAATSASSPARPPAGRRGSTSTSSCWRRTRDDGARTRRGRSVAGIDGGSPRPIARLRPGRARDPSIRTRPHAARKPATSAPGPRTLRCASSPRPWPGLAAPGAPGRRRGRAGACRTRSCPRGPGPGGRGRRRSRSRPPAG